MAAATRASIIALLCYSLWCVTAQETTDAAPEPAPQGSEDSCTFAAPEDYNLGAHIGSVFILLAVSFAGCFIPILLSLRQSKTMIIIIRLGMAFGFGTILSTAFIHMLTASLEQFSSPCLTGGWTEYEAWTQMFVVATIVVMQLADYLIEVAIARHTKTQDGNAAVRSPTKPLPITSTLEDGVQSHSQAVTEPSDDKAHYVKEVAKTELELTGHHFLAEFEPADLSQQWGFYLVETGIVLHSFLIGLTLGVADGSTFTSLLIALSFHQFFEGLAIGASAVSAGLGILKASILGIVYSLTTPIGIAVGIGIHESWNQNSVASLVTQGVLDAVAAGILIYVVLVELITPMLTKSSWMRRQHWAVQTLCIAAFWAGAAALAVIGKWA